MPIPGAFGAAWPTRAARAAVRRQISGSRRLLNPSAIAALSAAGRASSVFFKPALEAGWHRVNVPTHVIWGDGGPHSFHGLCRGVSQPGDPGLDADHRSTRMPADLCRIVERAAPSRMCADPSPAFEAAGEGQRAMIGA